MYTYKIYWNRQGEKVYPRKEQAHNETTAKILYCKHTGLNPTLVYEQIIAKKIRTRKIDY